LQPCNPASLQKESFVKRSKFLFPTIVLFLAMFLAACERTIPRDDPPEAPPVVDQLPGDDIFTPIQPTPDPTLPSNGYPPPELPGDEEAEPVEPAEPEADPPAPEPTVPTLPPDGTYTVQSGDTLYAIAQRFGVTVQALAQANGITNVNVLSVGDVLTIPGEGDVLPPTAADPGVERVHIVQRGETLYRIGLQYGFTVDELASHNNIADPTRIDVGQEIRIPAR
jgi:LysM repeat protein